MKLQNTIVMLAATTVVTNAAVVLSYQSGISTTTELGAADPTSQGWAYSGSGSGYSDGYNAGNGDGALDAGGWRTVDGTSGDQSVYTLDTSSIISNINSAAGYVMTVTLALDSDAQRDGAANVANYYSGSNSIRQNSILLYFDMDDVGSYRMNFRANVSDEVIINVSGTDYNTGVSLDAFGTYSITHDNTSGTAILDYGAGTASIGPSIADPNRSTIFMGSGSNGGQGSAVWNSMTIDTIPVPEPSSTALLGLGGLALILRRSK